MRLLFVTTLAFIFMLRLKLSLARSTQDVGADQALYTDTELKPEQKVCLTNILYYNIIKYKR